MVPELANTLEDDDPTLTPDQLEIYFETTRLGGFKVAVATRAAIDEPWSVPVATPEFASAGTEACPELSADGLTMLFSSDRPGGIGGYDLYIATRSDRASAWSVPALVPELNSTANEYCAVISPSGLELLYHSERAGGPGARDLYRTTRASPADPWQPPQLIAELSTPGNDESPFYVPGSDDLVIAFGSERDGVRDIYTARRSAIGAPFDPPVRVAIDTPEFEESDPWMSPDGRTLYFATNRTGNGEIAVTTR